ncbi:MAG: NUDIX domain-containing protein [Sulfitobacter sp.]
MRSLFFFGTMRHRPLLELVLGRSGDQQDVSDATLEGYRVSAVAEGPFPMIAVAPDAQATGIVVGNLSAEDIDRLDFYEGSFAYDLHAVTLADGRAAEVYVPQPGRWTPDGPWDLTAWEAAWGPLSVTAAAEVMSYRGNRSRDEVARMFPVIRARADATLRAANSRHGADTFKGRIEIDTRTRAYSQFFALDDIVLRHEHFDGTMSETLDRAAFVGVDAALVLPYDPVRDRVLVVEQIRIGPILRGDPTAWQWEPIAGRVDPGEDPKDTARREAVEEAGLTLLGMETISESYPSPGTSSEFYYLYLGIADLPDGITGTGGLASEGENIRSHVVSFDDLMARVGRFDVANGPLALAAYYLSHHRDRLRSEKAGDTPEG